MKPFAWSAAASLLALTAAADDKKEPPKDGGLKVVVDQFDAAWGIKFKSVAVKDNGPQHIATVKVTLDFTTDVADVPGMQLAFRKDLGNRMNLDDQLVVFLLFDEDNVAVGKYAISKIEGELTGVKGDAFRAVLEVPHEDLKRARKLDGRLAKPVKAKE